MSERYEHRNGEMQPPTEPGWYWFEGDIIIPEWPSGGTHHGLPNGPVFGPHENDQYGIAFSVQSFAVAPDFFDGWFWGPIPLPASDQEMDALFASYIPRAVR